MTLQRGAGRNQSPSVEAPSYDRVVVFAEPANRVNDVRRLLGSQAFQTAESRAEFAEILHTLPAGVILLEVIEEHDTAWLQEVAASRTPCIVVVPFTSSSVRILWALRATEIEPLDSTDMARDLQRMLAKLLAHPLDHIVREVLRANQPTPLISRALELIFRSQVPPSSVGALAEQLRVDPSTLRYYWTRDLSSSPTLKNLLGMVLLFRAIERRKGRPWPRVAMSHGVHLRTLERLCARVLGEPLGKTARNWSEARGALVESLRSAFG